MFARFCDPSYLQPGAGCGASWFELLRSSRAKSWDWAGWYATVGAAALDNQYQWYGSFVTGWVYACHPYAGGQFLMPVIANFHSSATFMSGSATWGSDPC